MRSATDFKDMASEIGSKADMNEAHKLKMMADGIGGWLGEKPWKAGQPKDGAILSAAAGGVYGKLDMVAKVSCYIFSNFWHLLSNFWQTLRGPFSAVSTPNFASK